jgi:hypothetical protein
MRKLIPLIIIVALLAGEVLELRARGAAQAAYERITRAIGPEGKMQALKREEVRQVVGRDADDFDERTGTEIFRWTGPLKPHTLYVQYLWVRGENYANDASVDADPRLGGSRPKTVVAPGAEP